ncbi:hypothetical protein D3Z58_07065 [Clostridiaceae bacterium]|nr:hypothetical protein [Clostridiaceae bacterium]
MSLEWSISSRRFWDWQNEKEGAAFTGCSLFPCVLLDRDQDLQYYVEGIKQGFFDTKRTQDLRRMER